MCLAVPVRVETLLDNDEAMVTLDGLRKKVSLALLDDVQEGDYVILHVGFALNKIDPAEAEKTLALFAQMQKQGELSAEEVLSL
jgi:hydrogenase expression/formation protein HypC